MLINGIPSWCSGYEEDMFDVSYKVGEDFPIFRGGVNAVVQWTPDDYFWDDFLANAVSYFLIDVTWLIMVWLSASIGSPTVPQRREKYIR